MWDELIEDLTDAFVRWQYPSQHLSDVPAMVVEHAADTTDYKYTVYVYCIFTLEEECTVTRLPESTSPALDLLAHGYVAATPRTPNVAISVKTLRLLHHLRLRKPSLSIEAFTKVICDFYKVSLS